MAVYEDLNDSGGPDAGEYIAKYQYDGLGRRIVRTDCTGASDVTYHDYYTPGWQLIEVRKNGKTDAHVHKQYVWGLRYIDAPVLRDRETDGGSPGLDERLYYTQDGNFNVTALVNPAGQVVERYAYDAYGQARVLDGDWSADADGASDVDNRTLYAGYHLDAETGLYHVRNRMYHPTLGRWVQRDPLGYVDGMSVYQYADGAPLAVTDPEGTQASDTQPSTAPASDPNQVPKSKTQAEGKPVEVKDAIAEANAVVDVKIKTDAGTVTVSQGTVPTTEIKKRGLFGPYTKQVELPAKSTIGPQDVFIGDAKKPGPKELKIWMRYDDDDDLKKKGLWRVSKGQVSVQVRFYDQRYDGVRVMVQLLPGAWYIEHQHTAA